MQCLIRNRAHARVLLAPIWLQRGTTDRTVSFASVPTSYSCVQSCRHGTTFFTLSRLSRARRPWHRLCDRQPHGARPLRTHPGGAGPVPKRNRGRLKGGARIPAGPHTQVRPQFWFVFQGPRSQQFPETHLQGRSLNETTLFVMCFSEYGEAYGQLHKDLCPSVGDRERCSECLKGCTKDRVRPSQDRLKLLYANSYSRQVKLLASRVQVSGIIQGLSCLFWRPGNDISQRSAIWTHLDCTQYAWVILLWFGSLMHP